MKQDEFTDLREKLRASIPPSQQSEVQRDLWPAMLRRMQRAPVRVPWFDWALATAAAAALLFFPEVIPALLYHL